MSDFNIKLKNLWLPPPNVECTNAEFSIKSFSALFTISYLDSPLIIGIVVLEKESMMFSIEAVDIVSCYLCFL